MIEILGSSVAALVATERLMAAGVDVRRTPTGRPNGFAHRVLPDGRKVETGCRLLELSYEPGDDTVGAWHPLSEYRPGLNHRPWIGTIGSYVRWLIDVGPEVERWARRASLVEVDPFLSGDPTSVGALLSASERNAAIDELKMLCRIRQFEAEAWVTFTESAGWNCGETIYETLIWPLVNKISGWADVPAAQHRKLWLPLWRAESLLDALRGEPSYKPVRPMHFGAGDLVAALEAATKDAIGDGWRGYVMVEEEYDLIDASLVPARALPPSVLIGVAWCDDEHADGVEWLIDADNPVFRRTWRDNICCVEFAAGANIERWAYDMSLTLLDKVEVRVPIGDVVCDDPRAVGYGSLNDQIVAGLAAADRLIREGRA